MKPQIGSILAPLLAAAFTGLISWYANRSTSQFYYGKLTQQVSDTVRRVGAVETDVKDHERRIGHIEGQRVNGAAVGKFPA